MLLLLIAAVFLRLHKIISVPPGITHDEADHGITAWSIVSEGVRDIYFTIGYGREPLYDYAAALLMTFLGPTVLAGRLTAVYFSLILIAGMAAWVGRAFSRQTALLTAAGLAVGFWPVMAGRQALRSILLPALFVLVVALFWRGLDKISAANRPAAVTTRGSLPLFLAAGVLLGLTFYTYIPARVLWIIFPALLGYLFLTDRPFFKQLWLPTLLMLLIMILIALPLLLFLGSNPAAELRIQQLAAPLSVVMAGEFGPLLQNMAGSLRLFVNEGDTAWRYNIAGRPFLGPLMGLLFGVGVLLAIGYTVRRSSERQCGPASFLALAWLLLGFLPVLVTGPELSMTQAIGMQPVLYLFPALSLLALGQIRIRAKKIEDSRWFNAGLALLFLLTAIITYRDYFLTWANNPEVRVQYETTLATAMEYLNEQGEGVALISSITPERYHSPAVGRMLLTNDAVEPRWFDARKSILLPQMDSGQLIIPGFTPLPAGLEKYFAAAELQRSIPMRETDLDRPLDIYTVNRATMSHDWLNQVNKAGANFAEDIQLLGYELQTPEVAAGEEVQIVTLWQAQSPVQDAVIFIHVLAPEGGEPIAQADQIGVPGYAWQQGDLFVHIHQFKIPEDTPSASYPLAVGIYRQTDGSRLPVVANQQSGDSYTFAQLTVRP
jgi:hypothetical protein